MGEQVIRSRSAAGPVRAEPQAAAAPARRSRSSRCSAALAVRSAWLGAQALGRRRASRRRRRPRPSAPAAEAAQDRLPRGLHARADGRAHRRGGQDRRREAQGAPKLRAADYRRLTRRSQAAGAACRRRQVAAARGLPLPGDVRVPAEDDDEAARATSSSSRSTRHWEKIDLAYAKLEEPDALRRADHRVDGREGDARARRAPEGRAR